MADVLIIIVTFNSEKWIKKNLLSLYDQDKLIDVLVVDNNSSDNTIAIVEDYFPQVKIIKLDKNILDIELIVLFKSFVLDWY